MLLEMVDPTSVKNDAAGEKMKEVDKGKEANQARPDCSSDVKEGSKAKVNDEEQADSMDALENHVRMQHPAEYRFHCKTCHYYTTTTEAMETHLSGESHLEVAKEQNAGTSFEDCVEKVLVIQQDKKASGDSQTEQRDFVVQLSEGTEEVQKADDAVTSVLAEGEMRVEDSGPPKRKRGRPRVTNVTTCSHCGLVASNPANLSVHIRRRHSRQYSFLCKLCNYYCVTKGDMDRHCATKKHLKRTKAASNPDSAVQLLKAEQAASASGEEEVVPPAGKEGDKDGVSQSEEEGTVEEAEATLSDPSLKTSKYDSVNSCPYCDFVAHSIPSLALHVRRKHTKEFEFVCLACSYYAVTRREMSRHASTEKHKQKSQIYLEKQGRSVVKDLAELNERMGLENVVGLESPGAAVATEPPSADAEQAAQSLGQFSSSPAQTDDAVNTQGPCDTVKDKRMAEEGTGLETLDSKSDLNRSDGSDTAQTKVDSTDQSNTYVSDTNQSTPGEKDAPETEAEVDDENTDDEDEDIVDSKADGSFEKQLLRAVPFDACILPLKALQDDPLQTAEGEVVTSGSGGVSGTASVKRSKAVSGSGTRGATPNPRIRCEDCGFLADGLSGLNVHISMKHPSKEKHFHCLLCGKSFYTESNLHQHMNSAAHMRNEQASIEELPEGGASFKCVRCNEPFQTEQELFVHIKEKHEELLREVNKYVYEDTEQINREREENQGSVCKYCGKVCKSSNSMAFLAHVRTHTGSKPFMCTICNFATAQLGDARNHVKRHLGMREYKCHICGWAFVMKKHLSTHLLGKHGLGRPKERKYECEVCNRAFSEKWALNNHMKLHTGDKPYKCAWPACHYSFLTLSAMKDHYRTHTGEKSFLCDLCGFAGGTRHALTKHRRQHTGERPFKCQLCSFASTTQSHLTRHKRVHTGEKPYRCPWCDYRSNCAENIRKHILHTGKHEGVKMYNCPKCDYATNAPMDFRNHLKEMHPDIENPDLAYLHAGIVSKSYECRLKGQGASFVEAEAAFAPEESVGGVTVRRVGSVEGMGSEAVQQVIIIQGYGDSGGEVTIDQALEQSAAATLQTLAMAGQVAEVLHITEDGQVIASGREVAATGARLAGGQIQLPAGATQYVLVESSGEAALMEGQESAETVRVEANAGTEGTHVVSESSSALDALLCAVTELGQQGGASSEGEIITTTVSGEVTGEDPEEEETAEHREVQVFEEVMQEDGTEQVVAQVVGHGHEDTPDEMVQEVLQFAASQLMMKEGLTQVIVNDEGTHYIVTELDDSTLQVEGAVYTQSEGTEQEQGLGEVQPADGTVVYSDISSVDTAQE
ncbi:zinc finger protein 407 [Chanos chanos]|uniref:Zinc finger protein 407 n=1 Tax=Chanos chanos TaxID=29144 RepID=A0A6J2W402_CHACN|nr:zinc finger protein 407 [Chanos chanos]